MEIVDAEAPRDEYGSLPAAPALAATVQAQALRRGLIVELGGRHAAVIRLLPPLTITDEQTEAVLDRLADAIGAAERTVRRERRGDRRERAPKGER